ncbi:MAG: acetyl-CoA carboxylase biotin carboxyl carrier protein subunit [Bacteroidales bacterium]|nr:acetyl-CoA carboxylase biotin carboxyl carrier protein subunit [Bacteroidales bacterium]
MNCKPLQIEETIYNTQYTKKFENRKFYQPVDPNKILAYIPGTILKIFVKEGTVLKAGDSILILEAMKMRNVVTMPFNGKLRKIYVKEGDIVAKNFLIAEIE